MCGTAAAYIVRRTFSLKLRSSSQIVFRVAVCIEARQLWPCTALATFCRRSPSLLLKQMPCRSSSKKRNRELGACGAFFDRCKHDAIIAALASPAVRPNADPAAQNSIAARGSALHPRYPRDAKWSGCATQTEQWKSKRCGWNPKK